MRETRRRGSGKLDAKEDQQVFIPVHPDARCSLFIHVYGCMCVCVCGGFYAFLCTLYILHAFRIWEKKKKRGRQSEC